MVDKISMVVSSLAWDLDEMNCLQGEQDLIDKEMNTHVAHTTIHLLQHTLQHIRQSNQPSVENEHLT